ncbi:hypothetical protein ABZP36_002626 [Zizania latifolia]
MSQVCQSWRAAIVSQQHTLPWIFVSSTDGPSFSCAVPVRCCATHKLLVSAYAYKLLNLHIKQHFDLPRYIVWLGLLWVIQRNNFDIAIAMVMKAMTLSSPLEDEHYFGATISSFRPLMNSPRISAFLLMGYQVALMESVTEVFGEPVLEDFYDDEDGVLVIPPKEIY